jgi:thymidylate synthase (FAD)
LASQSTINKQGRADLIEGDYAQKVLNILRTDALQAYDHYEYLLNDDGEDQSRPGLSRELARMNLPVNFYTQWYWKVDLHNLMHFLSLRADSHAQYEIRAYAETMLDIVKLWVPHTYEAFMNYRVGGVHLSANAMKVLKRMLAGEMVDQSTSGMGMREWDEFMDVIKTQ